MSARLGPRSPWWPYTAGWAVVAVVALLIAVPVASPPTRFYVLLAAVAAAYVAAICAAVPRFPTAAGIVATLGTGFVVVQVIQGPATTPPLALMLAVLPPAALGAAWVLGRTEQARLVAQLRRLTTPATAVRVESALAQVLRADGLQLLLRASAGDEWLRGDGEPAAGPLQSPGHRVHLVGDPEAPVAAVRLPGAVTVSPGRLDTVLRIAALPIESVRLQALLSAQLRELRLSRARIVRAAVEERHRLARDLHDGAQQHLLVLSTQLAGLDLRLAQTGQTDAQVSAAALQGVADAQQLLRGALSDLRGLSREVFPPALETDGFVASLEALGDRLGLDVLVQGQVEDCPQEVLVVAFWAIEDVARHLPQNADGVRVVASQDGQTLTLRVTALPQGAPLTVPDGAWQQATRDRLAALGGTLVVGSARGPSASRGSGRPQGEREDEWLEVAIPYV